ncbi:AAA-domain-containing protein [Ceraceosorus guamensis]|uniref:Peroxisomal ATPase PEX1 n=1 Tax=Ceraceosorus guamensis TaxID=1522189 RepID=A0A316VQV8_9BASI|nr:AAA-domain-containing protein [Ceraceosorus guamensis]PWN38783.1 AAA-domain-containing protein [Ceraceosorus guamensis]
MSHPSTSAHAHASAHAPRRSKKATQVSAVLDASLRSSLAHLPSLLYEPLLARNIAAQSIVLELTRLVGEREREREREGKDEQQHADAHPHPHPHPHHTTTRRDVVYAGWSGLPSSATSSASPAPASASTSSPAPAPAHPPLTLSPLLAASFSPPLQPHETLHLILLRSPPLPIATRLRVTPLTPDDWEMLSANAGMVEEHLLAQVRAAKTGSVIHVALGTRTGAHSSCAFHVDSTEPGSAAHDGASAARAVKLTTDTEIIVAPRVRKSAAESAAAEHHAIHSSNTATAGTASPSSSASAAAQALATLSKQLHRILPAKLSNSSSGSSSSSSPTPSLPPPTCIWVSRRTAQLLSLALGSDEEGTCGKAALTLVKCPTAAHVRPGVGKARGAKEDAHADADADADGQAARPTRSVVWHVCEHVLDRNVVLGKAVQQGLGARDWELVSFSSASPGFSSRPSTPSAELDEPDLVVESDEEEELSGMSGLMDRAYSHLYTALRSQRLAALQAGRGTEMNTRASGALHVTGASGTGKSTFCRSLCRSMEAHGIASIRIDCAHYSELRPAALRSKVREWVNAAAWCAPSVLWLDDVERVCPAEVEHAEGTHARFSAETLLAAVQRRESNVLLLCSSNGNVHKELANSHVFKLTLQIKTPDKQARKEIIGALVRERSAKMKEQQQGQQQQHVALDVVQLAGKTEGYCPADLRDLVERAAHQAAIRVAKVESETSLTLGMSDFDAAQHGFVPLNLRDVKLETSSVAWSDIGGLQATRQTLRETLEWPTKYAAIFKNCPLRLRSGLLLYGYPGCGKTLLASAVAKECGLNFISVKGPEILNKYIGASEKSVRDLFDRAQAAKPCVLFFDEFDSIAPKRGHDSTGVTDRVVNQLLTQMDGAEGLDGVYVLAATSRPDLIDSALLRPGRLDKSLLCDMPDIDDRLDILRAVAKKIRLHAEVDLERWARETEGFSGADLQALLYNAHLETIHEAVERAPRPAADGGGGGGGGDKTVDVDMDRIRLVDLNEAGGSGSTNIKSAAERMAQLKRVQTILSSTLASRTSHAPSHTGGARSGEKSGGGASGASASAGVTDAHISKSLRTTRPSVPASERERLRGVYGEFAGDEKGGRAARFPDGEASREVGARESLM